VKPASEGSSVGVYITDTLAELGQAIAEVTRQYGLAFCERYIKGQEITVGVLGWEESLRALPVLELAPHSKFYDYEAKYTAGATDFLLPARLSPEVTHRVQALAVQAHLLLGCHGYSRVDMLVGEDGQPYLIEINTLPGLTDTSDLPAEAEVVGISYDQLVEEILASAFARNPA
jgi:D-alanine-D-alanine ligase